MPASAIARIAAGFLLAPLAGILALTIFVCLSGPGPSDLGGRCLTQLLPFLAWVGLLCVYPPTLVLGVPLFFVLGRLRQLRPVPLALLGLVIGIVSTALFFVLDKSYRIEPVQLLVEIVPFSIRAGVGFAGPIGGIAFWAIAVFRNGALARRDPARNNA